MQQDSPRNESHFYPQICPATGSGWSKTVISLLWELSPLLFWFVLFCLCFCLVAISGVFQIIRAVVCWAQSRSLPPFSFPAFLTAVRNWPIRSSLAPTVGFLPFSGFCPCWMTEKEQALVFGSLTDFCKNILVEEFLSFYICLCIFRISQAMFLFLFTAIFF